MDDRELQLFYVYFVGFQSVKPLNTLWPFLNNLHNRIRRDTELFGMNRIRRLAAGQQTLRSNLLLRGPISWRGLKLGWALDSIAYASQYNVMRLDVCLISQQLLPELIGWNGFAE
ncbi:MAG: hypothetical protein ACXWF8_15165 [Methylobacter sp.]